ncbi:MAG: RNA polymerase sigma factor (sigma-70 family) [Flavobacteriales bacterium]
MSGVNLLVSLYEKYQLDLKRLISVKFNKSQDDAEDIIQDAFHNLLRIENIDSIENPKAYLYQTASNLALNRLRKQRRHNNYIASQDEHAVDTLSPDRQAMGQRDLQKLEQAMGELPQKYQTTFLLSRVQAKSYRQIAEELCIAESTVEKHIIKTLKHLRNHLDEGVGA